MTALSSESPDRDRPVSGRSVGRTVLLAALVALAAVVGVGSAVADSGSGAAGVALSGGGASLAADVATVERTIDDSEVAPGGVAAVDVTVETSGELGTQELVQVTEAFSPGVADARLVDSAPGAGGAAASPDGDEFLAIWNEDATEYTLTYDVLVPLDAEAGDTYEISGTAAVGDDSTSIGSDSLSVSGDATAETTVRLTPSAATAASGEGVTYDLVVTGADEGVGSYSVNVSSTNASVATISDVSLANQADTDRTEIADGGTSVVVDADLGDSDHAAGNGVTIAQITVDAGQSGVGALEIGEDATVANATGAEYDVAAVSGARLTVPDPDAAATETATDAGGETATDEAGDETATDEASDGTATDEAGDTTPTATEAADDPTPTATEPSEGSTDAADGDTGTSGSGPGLGVTTALAALVATGFLLARRRADRGA